MPSVIFCRAAQHPFLRKKMDAQAMAIWRCENHNFIILNIIARLLQKGNPANFSISAKDKRESEGFHDRRNKNRKSGGE
ncbi:hypothetical protein [Oscillibacter ruminantium]